MTYIPVDYSVGMLQKTMDYNYATKDESYPNIKSISQSPKVFALLRNIFGNFDENHILDVVTKTMGFLSIPPN